MANSPSVQAPSADVFSQGPRVFGLEWLRAGMTFGVLAFHAAVPYTQIPLPGLNWSVHEPLGCPIATVCCWGLNGLIMPVFFLLAGFCGARIFAHQGANRFLEHRTRRLLPALLFGGGVILPLTGYCWFLSWTAQGFMPLDRLWRWGIPDELERDLYGLGHLWFVQYLWLFCVVVWVTSQLMRHVSDHGIVRLHHLQKRLMTSFWMPALFAIPAAIVLANEPQIVIGFRQSILPQWANLAYYWPFFVAGFWLQCCERRGASLACWCELRGVLAIVTFIALWPYLKAHVHQGSTGVDRWMTAGLFSLYAWLAASSLFGLSIKYLDREPPSAVKYVTEGSMWVYLIHVPLVSLIQMNLLFVSVPVVLKFLLTVLGGVVLSMATYYAFVRRTRLGQFLDPVSQSQIAIKREVVASEPPDVVPVLAG